MFLQLSAKEKVERPKSWKRSTKAWTGCVSKTTPMNGNAYNGKRRWREGVWSWKTEGWSLTFRGWKPMNVGRGRTGSSCCSSSRSSDPQLQPPSLTCYHICHHNSIHFSHPNKAQWSPTLQPRDPQLQQHIRCHIMTPLRGSSLTLPVSGLMFKDMSTI